VSNLNWKLILHQDQAEAFNLLALNIMIALGVGLLVLLVTALLAVFFAQRFSRPILELTTVAEQVTAGDLEAQAQLEVHDEIGTLAQTFNTMTARLREMLQREEVRSIELEASMVEQERLQQEIINSQHQVIQELSTPVIPITDQVIALPLIGSIDSMRARDITRALLAGISQHNARVVILDVTGVKFVDTGVANHLNKTIQAARLKGAYTIVAGISDAVAETIVELGVDWSGVETVSDLQSGLQRALEWIDEQHKW
jgi:anti-anti-sigma regulatory factor/HAMP domain-containing protein